MMKDYDISDIYEDYERIYIESQKKKRMKRIIIANIVAVAILLSILFGI